MNVSAMLQLLPPDLQARMQEAGVTDEQSLEQALMLNPALNNEFQAYLQDHQEELYLATIISSLPEEAQQQLRAAGVNNVDGLQQAIDASPELQQAISDLQQSFIPQVLNEVLTQLLFAALPPDITERLEQLGVHDEASFQQAVETDPILMDAIRQFEEQQQAAYQMFIEFAFAPDVEYLEELVEEQPVYGSDEFIEFVRIVIEQLQQHDDPEAAEMSEDLEDRLHIVLDWQA